MITRRDFLKVSAAGGALASLGGVAEAKAAGHPDHRLGKCPPNDFPARYATELLTP